ncbi:hypothetical protein HPP92_019180 [Vanilla planifolia]|uniref:FHA domain-containing protein n=1 Tax=Vanilla planifolia TaxID=51239 RepID=A0A835Q738_VANPL|nr:hypothetical protein HPP92_019180 [Vanilla planifolia]
MCLKKLPTCLGVLIYVILCWSIKLFPDSMQFSKNSAYLYDLGSTHGTFVNKNQVKKKVYTEIHVGDVIRFGQSSRLYIFQGPAELMPPEGDLEKLRKVKVQEENCDREASLSRARKEALFANGISWGMTEDAIEEELENDADEITWQTYKGQLTERQEKMHSKIIKRMEKVSNMKKEIDAIRAKDIAQGGLTQGQQTQIARNEQRISQIMEELDSLEETMNDSIRESLGARAAKSVVGRTKVNNEEEEDVLSEDDEFYDRTKKKISAKKSGEVQSVETADTLLDKIDAISSEIEEKRKLLAEEKDKVSSTEKVNQGEDDLDAFMSGLSSQLVIDNTTKMENTLDDLHVELERTKYLLGIADPSGEASRRRAGKAAEPQVPQCTQPIAVTSTTESPSGKARNTVSSKPKDSRLVPEEKAPDKAVPEEEKVKEVYTIAKPQWLGATRENPSEAGNDPLVRLDNNESDEFVDYKDRKKFLSAADDNGDLENAAPGLIIRKRKQAENLDYSTGKPTKVESPSSTKAETAAADAVALLLKHKRGFYGSEEATDEEQTSQGGGHPVKEGSRTRRVLGPARPDFIDRVPDYETWVPPKGQTGDGRTSLNDRLGY